MTNFEYIIKNMTVEQIATSYAYGINGDCNMCPIKQFCDEQYEQNDVNCCNIWLQWLKSEYNGEIDFVYRKLS